MEPPVRRTGLIVGIAGAFLVTCSTLSSTATEHVVHNAYLTGYSWYDNTPPGSAAIRYARSDGHPTTHDTAGGTGTYADPVTLAAGWSTATGEPVPDWPVGERIYLPGLRKYAIVEDVCGDQTPPQHGPCHDLAEAPNGAETWLDVWVGGEGYPEAAVRRCMERITGLHTAVVRPRRGYPVTEGTIAASCTEDPNYPDAGPGD